MHGHETLSSNSDDALRPCFPLYMWLRVTITDCSFSSKPALLYLVPASLITSMGMALLRGEVIPTTV